MAEQSTTRNKEKIPLTAISLYYKRMLIYFDAIARFNQVRPLYELLDADWMPDELRKVYRKKYNEKPAQVQDAYSQFEADIELDWGRVMDSLKDLDREQDEQTVKEFRNMAESTIEESKFREKVRGRLERRLKAWEKEMGIRDAGGKRTPFYVDTPRKLLPWYRERVAKDKAKAAAKKQ